MKLLGNILFLVFGGFLIILPGLELALMHMFLAAFFALTIIGIPLAKQHVKLLPLALLPFGRIMRDVETGRVYP